jgi:4-amino-4-deoxy-L-arabinose transferase-like glycosyltransferase
MTQSRRSILLLLGAFALLSLYTMASLPLGLDEAYYWYWAKHPALSYLDHPPLVAWTIALSTALGGNGALAVRLGGFLLLWVGFGCGFATVRRLFPRAAPGLAWEYLLVLNLTVIFPGATLIHTPDTPLLACWLTALYFGARIAADQDRAAWYGLGPALGLGMLAKYTMVLLIPGMLLFLLLSPGHRHWLGRREPWLAALLALLVWTPVPLWNWQHDWVSFQFQLHHGFKGDEDSALDKVLGYAAGQAAIVSPLLWLTFVWYSLRGMGTGLPEGLRGGSPACLYLTLMSWPVVLFFACTSLCGTQAEANWPAPAYAAGLMLAWAVLRGALPPHRGNRRVAQLVLAVSLLLNVALRTHLVHPWLPLRPADDRMRELAGWQALGHQVQAAIDAHPHPTGWFLMGDKGTTLAEALYYTGNRYLGFDPARPERYLFLDDPNDRLRGKDAIVLAHDDAPTRARFGRYFRRLVPLGPYRHQYRGQEIPRLSTYLLLGEDFLGNWEVMTSEAPRLPAVVGEHPGDPLLARPQRPAGAGRRPLCPAAPAAPPG